MTMNGMSAIFLLVLVGVVGYFIPFCVALVRGHRNKGGIFVLNTFFGWTILGWVGALIWALWNDKGAIA